MDKVLDVAPQKNGPTSSHSIRGMPKNQGFSSGRNKAAVLFIVAHAIDSRLRSRLELVVAAAEGYFFVHIQMMIYSS